MPNRGSSVWMATLACALGLGSHALAGEDGSQQARRHLDRGVELLDQGAFEQALTEIIQAYEIEPSAAALWRIAQAYAALDRPVEALETLEQYERDSGGQLEPEQRAQLDALLAKMRARVGRLVLIVQPAGAEVLVDGKSVGRAPLAADLPVLAGEHRISARFERHGEQAKTVSVPGGRPTTVELLLEPLERARSPVGGLVVECPVPAVRVRVDGKPIGTTPLFGPVSVPRGRHEISFARSGYVMTPKRIEVAPGKTATISCDARLTRPLPPALAGTVDLTLSEQDATVTVDGQPWPPDGRLPAGPHVLTAQQAGFAPVKVDFSLKAGENKDLHIGLASLRGEQLGHPVEQGAGAGRVLAYVSGALGLAAGGVAFGLALWNDGRRDDWQSEQDALDQAASAGALDPAELARRDANDELGQDIETVDGVSIGLGIGAGALLLTGIIAFVASGDSEPTTEALVVAPQPGGAVLGWTTAW